MTSGTFNLKQEIGQLVEKLPSQSWHNSQFQFENGYWYFEFECNHTHGTFYSKAVGVSPQEAFGTAKTDLLNQIEAWHEARFSNEPVDEHKVLNKNSTIVPRVLIVDDDIDAALSLQTALSQLGYHTEIATKAEEAHQKIATSDADYIFLDWKLNNDITAKQVMQKAVRLIDAFSDLRMKFSVHRPKIVTHSVLNQRQVHLPDSLSRYFKIYGHWQKPLGFHEMIRKATDLFLDDQEARTGAA